MTLWAIFALAVVSGGVLIWFSARGFRAGRNVERAGRARADLETYADAQKRAHEAANAGGPVDSSSVNERLRAKSALRD